MNHRATGWGERWATTIRFDVDGRFDWARNFGRVDGIDLPAWSPRIDIDADDRLVLGGGVAPRYYEHGWPPPRYHTFETRGANGNRLARALVATDSFDDIPLPPMQITRPIRWTVDRRVLFTPVVAEQGEIEETFPFLGMNSIRRLRSNFTLDPVPVYYDSGLPVDYRSIDDDRIVVAWNNGSTTGWGGVTSAGNRSMLRMIDGDEMQWSAGLPGTAGFDAGTWWFRRVALGDGFIVGAGDGWQSSEDDDFVPVLLVDQETGDLLWPLDQFGFPTDGGSGPFARQTLLFGLAARGDLVAVSWDRQRATAPIPSGAYRVALINAATGSIEWLWKTDRPTGPCAIDSEGRVWVSVGGELHRFTRAGDVDVQVTVSRSTCPLERVIVSTQDERPSIVVGEPVDDPSGLVTELVVDSRDGVIAALSSQYWKAPEWL